MKFLHPTCRIVVTCLLYSGLLMDAAGQSQVPSGDPFVPKLEPVPPSPQAADLGKYGDIPVGHQTGIPNISIPIYTITLNDFSYPISLNYHSTGNKVDDIASNTGLGWSLLATGSISRATKGPIMEMPDDAWTVPHYSDVGSGDPCTYISSPPTEYEDAKYFMEQQYNFETHPYTFNFAGFTGRLFIRPDSDTTIVDEGQSASAQQGVVIPAQNLKIYTAPKFFAIDENGIRYYFEKYETSSMESQCVPGTVTTIFYPPGNESLFLSRIVTPNGDTVKFTYVPEYYSYIHSRSQSMLVPYENGNDCELGIILNNLEECTNTMYVNGWRLRKIEATNGQRVEFEYSTRSDLVGAYKLDVIKIFNNGIQAIKEFRLYTSYFGGAPSGNESQDELGLKLRLDSLKEFSSGSSFPAYTVSYFSGAVTPRVYGEQDYFGFGIGGASYYPTSIIPGQPDINYNGANRNATLSGSVSGMLQKITYPTKGYSEFEYELEATGGVRIKYIKDFNHDETLLLKRHFRYGSSTSGPDTGLWVWFKGSTSLIVPQAIDPSSLCYYWTLSSKSQMNDIWDYPRRYGYIEEIHEDAQGNPNGKTSFSYGSNVIILEASLYYSVLVQQNTETYFSDQSFLNDPLVNKTIWRLQNASTDEWLPVHKTEYQYEIPGIHETTLKNFRLIQLEPEQIDVPNCRPAEFMIRRYQYVSTWYRQKKVTETHYDESGNAKLTTETETLEYDPVSLKPKKIQTTFSNGKTVESTFSYPSDFESISPYDDMIAKNMVGPVITHRQSVDDLLVNEIVIPFDEYNSTIKPAAVYSFDRGTSEYLSSNVPAVSNPSSPDPDLYFSLATDIHYDAFGNITHFKRPDGAVIMFKWGYESQFFVARKEAGNSLDFYFTSFEEEGESGFDPDPIKAQTGTKVLNSGSFSIPFQPGNPNDYVMSYWYYQDNAWHFSGEVAFASAINTSATYLDEIRVYPKGSLITTYTFDFEKGVTTVTDHNNRSQYFDYDNLNRLSFISDQDRNVLSFFMYNYRK